jgi:hypothetical protein
LSVSSRIAAVAVTTVVAAGTLASVAGAQTPTPAPGAPGDTVVTPGAPVATDATRNDSNNSCSLHLKSQDRPSLEDDLTVGYSLRCATPITGYSLSVSAGSGVPPVSGFETEVFAIQKGTGAVLPDQGFSCTGEQPGYGVNCTGYYGGAYATLPGTFDMETGVSNLRQVLGLSVTATVFRAVPSPDGKGGYKKNADGSPTIVSYVAGPFKAKIDDPGLRSKASKSTAAKAKAKAKAKAARAKAAKARARAHR